MIVGIDVSSIPYGTGVSNYTLNLVKNLIRLGPTHQYKLFFSSFRQPLPPEISILSSHPNVKIYHFHLPPSLLQFIWNQLHVLPIELFIGHCDIFHTWNWLQPPTLKAKTVTTIHDLSTFLYPKWHHLQTIKAENQKMYWAIRDRSTFICVSQNTQNDLQRIFPSIQTTQCHLVYEAAEVKYHKFYQLPPRTKISKISKIKKQYGLSQFILAQGTVEPRKNLHRLIKAFLKFKANQPNSTIELAIAGKYGWGNQLRPATGVKILGYIPEKDMVPLHAAALVLAYTSLYEGFGLPVVKAFNVGTPVITSNTSSLAEIADSAAILVDPHSTRQIYQAIVKISSSPLLRQSLVRHGLKQAKKYNWSTTAHHTLDVYNQVLSIK